MKKMIATLLFVSAVWMVQAAGELSYVVVDGKAYFTEEVKVGISNVRIATDEGLTLKAPLKKVDAIFTEGKLVERMPVVCHDGKTKGSALMQFVAQGNDLRLYKCYSDNQIENQDCCFTDGSNREARLIIYRNGELYLPVNEKNAPTVLPFFHITLKEKI